jgi:hypothetical protein
MSDVESKPKALKFKAIQVTDFVKFKPQLGRKYFEVNLDAIEADCGRPREEWLKIAVGVHPSRNNTVAVFVVVDGESEKEKEREVEEKKKADDMILKLGQRGPRPEAV